MKRPEFSRTWSALAVTMLFSPYALATHFQAPAVEVSDNEVLALPSISNPLMSNRDLIRLRSNTSDSARLLEDFAGVSLYAAGGLSSLPEIHGMADDRIRIKVDGMDLISGCANHMNSPLSYIDPAQVGSIKVFSALTPVSMGGDSIAGTIVVQSPAPEFASSADKYLIKGQLGTFYRSNNDARGANISTTFATEDFSASYRASTVTAENYHAGGKFHDAGPAWQYKTSMMGAPIYGPRLAGDEVGSSAFKSNNQTLSFAFKRDAHLFEIKLGLQNIPYQGFANQRMDMTDNQSAHGQIKYTGSFDWGKLQLAAYHEQTRHSMNFGDDKLYNYISMMTGWLDVLGMPMQTRGKNTGVSAKLDYLLSSSDVVKLGLEYQRYRLDDWWPAVANSSMMGPEDFQNIRNGKRDRADVFVEWDREWSRQWMTQAGVRLSQLKTDSADVQGYNPDAVGSGMMQMSGMADQQAADTFNSQNHKKTDHNIDLSLLAKYISDETRFFEFGYTLKNRSPSLYERYSWHYLSSMNMNMVNWVGDGNGYVGNQKLEREQAHTLSATVDLHSPDLSHRVRITPYISYIHDYIAAVPCNLVYVDCVSDRADGFVNLSLANQNARITGLDISGITDLGSWAGVGAFKLRSQMRYTHGRNLSTGDDLYHIMPLNAKLGLEHRVGQWSNLLEWKLVTAKNRVDDVRKELPTSGYQLLNFYSSYDWEKVRLDFAVENILDKQYDLPLGGVYLGQGSTMMSNPMMGSPSYATALPGMGRSVNVGLTSKF